LAGFKVTPEEIDMFLEHNQRVKLDHLQSVGNMGVAILDDRIVRMTYLLMPLFDLAPCADSRP